MQKPELTELAHRLAGPNRTRILKKDEERDAAIAWQTNQDEAARTLLIQSHVKIVAKEVSRMRFYKADTSDLFSAGMEGLTIALDRFDPEAGFRFYTYAIHWIREKLKAHVLLTEGTMRMPNSSKQRRLFFNYRKAMTAIAKKAHKEGRELSRSELMEQTAKALDVSIDDIEQIHATFESSSSFDAPMGSDEGDDFTLADILADQAPRAEDVINLQERSTRMRSDIAAALAKLNAREQQIILNRKLAPEGKEMTLLELSEIFNVSKERVRQVEVNALRKLERSLAPTRELLEAA
jgi:RNA polymerase sigma-32 factor